MEERIQEVPPDLQIQLDELRVRVEAIERDFAEFRKRPLVGISRDYDWGKGTAPKWDLMDDLLQARFTEDDFKENS